MLNPNKDNQQVQIQKATNTSKPKLILKRIKAILPLGIGLTLIIFGLLITYTIYIQEKNSESYSYTKKDIKAEVKKFQDLSDIIITEKTNLEPDLDLIEKELDDTEIIKANLITPETTIAPLQNDTKSIIAPEIALPSQSDTNSISQNSDASFSSTIPVIITSSSSTSLIISNSSSASIISSSSSSSR